MFRYRQIWFGLLNLEALDFIINSIEREEIP
jgi:hypothetical protein